MTAEMLDRGDGVRLAFRRQPGREPIVCFLPGFASDMTGAKAEALAGWCAARSVGFLSLDYSGHGASDGAFADGTIGRWTADARAVIEHACNGPLLLVGSSMGGWIALLLALTRPDRVAAIVGVAAAPDFTEDLMWAALMPAERERLLADGQITVPSAYGPPQVVTRHLIEEGRQHLVLRGPIALTCPVRLLHGERDPDVPWETALKIAACLAGDDVHVTLVKGGEHRLSRPGDLDLLCRTVGQFFD